MIALLVASEFVLCRHRPSAHERQSKKQCKHTQHYRLWLRSLTRRLILLLNSASACVVTTTVCAILTAKRNTQKRRNKRANHVATGQQNVNHSSLNTIGGRCGIGRAGTGAVPMADAAFVDGLTLPSTFGVICASSSGSSCHFTLATVVVTPDMTLRHTATSNKATNTQNARETLTSSRTLVLNAFS